mmetsp:Transcript_95843/g.310636  ORF Transcript_95843/g.310636 Transcript_95843/m.310636 type:complete len:447 (+) Transcript_95843:587-1927(+)
MDRSGRRDTNGLTPVWLRMEYNCIQWAAIEQRLESQQVRWCAAESRDGWGPKDSSPMVCMHSSYKNQKVEEPADPTAAPPAQAPNRSSAGAAASSGGGGAGTGDTGGGGGAVSSASPLMAAHEDPSLDEAGLEQVPMYVFLDASAVRRFAAEKGSAHMKERLFTFQGLLNLCNQGHMKCIPSEENPYQAPAWVGNVEEQDRIIFVVTDSVLDELARISEHSAPERRQVDWLRNGSDSYLQTAHYWGILEVLETKLHTKLIKLEGWEQRARDLSISRWALQNFDFACLWESQIESPGRVLFVTADDALCTFAAECARDDESLRRVIVTHVHNLDRTFAADREHGGHRLYEAAQKLKANNKFCGAVLSAQVMHELIVEPAYEGRQPGGGGGGDGREEALKLGLREALSMLTDVRQVVEGSRNPNETARFLERVEDAQRRWQALLRNKS